MALFVIALIIGINLWLRMYTNHGQKLTLPDFQDMHILDARKLAKEKSFDIIVNDSLQIVGKPGGLVISQNPRALTQVKENRKVYVTTTKYKADQIRSSSLPTLYGREFAQKKKELEYLQLKSVIKDYMYDPGAPDHILEVYYNGKMIANADGKKPDVKIDKGGTLAFVLSKRSGLELNVPDLRCKSFGAAQFMIEDGARLKIGNVRHLGEISDENSAYVVSQYPPFESGATLLIGESIDVVLSAEKPIDCN